MAPIGVKRLYSGLRDTPRPVLLVAGPFWALLALLVFGIVATFGSIPDANVIWAVGGLVIFGGYTIFDFNRLRRAGGQSAVPIAASIFLDVLNVFLFFLELFGGARD